MATSDGTIVHQCPKCSGRKLRVFCYQCLVCKEDFPKPHRQVFPTRADALKAHGQFTADVRKQPKEFYVDVCPKCESPLMIESGFKCVCGEAFNRFDAVLLWEAGGR